MTPNESQRWSEVRRLVHEALTLEPERRDSYLAEACGINPNLQREVESFLRHEAEAKGMGYLQERCSVCDRGANDRTT